jgi:hypothetical protein
MVRFFWNALPNSVTKNRVFSVLMMVILATRSGSKGFKMPSILRTIVHDAIVYFLVIFTPHFVLEMTLLLARVSISTLGDGRGAEISPAESSALVSYISARFNTYQRTTLIKSPCVVLILSENNVCVLIAWWTPQTHSNPTHRYLPIMVSRLMLS